MDFKKQLENRISSCEDEIKTMKEALTLLNSLNFKIGDPVFHPEHKFAILSDIFLGNLNNSGDSLSGQVCAYIQTVTGAKNVLLSELMPYTETIKLLYGNNP